MVRGKGILAVTSILPAALCAVVWPVPVAAQARSPSQEVVAGQGVPKQDDPSKDDESSFRRTWRKIEQFREILEGSRQTIGNWDYYAMALRIMIERVWQEHGTGGESDRFARELAIRFAEVPPWKMERFATVTAMLRERYNMNDEQAMQLIQGMNRAAFQTFVRNTDVMLTVGKEMADVGGLTGDPQADADRIVRWAKMCKPLRADSLRFVEVEAQGIIAALDGEHQKLAKEDLETFRRWHAYGGRLIDRWIAGDWRYEDLGLTPEVFDPRWLESQMRRLQAGPAAASQWARPADADAEAVDAWTAYVQGFIRRHNLDPAQRQTAMTILRELRERAIEYMLSHRTDLQELDRRPTQTPAAERQATERQRRALLEPIDSMFLELKDRLESLLTASQRTAAPRPTDQ